MRQIFIFAISEVCIHILARKNFRSYTLQTYSRIEVAADSGASLFPWLFHESKISSHRGTLVELRADGDRLSQALWSDSYRWLLLIFDFHAIFNEECFSKWQDHKIPEFSKHLCVRSAKNHLLWGRRTCSRWRKEDHSIFWTDRLVTEHEKRPFQKSLHRVVLTSSSLDRIHAHEMLDSACKATLVPCVCFLQNFFFSKFRLPVLRESVQSPMELCGCERYKNHGKSFLKDKKKD